MRAEKALALAAAIVIVLALAIGAALKEYYGLAAKCSELEESCSKPYFVVVQTKEFVAEGKGKTLLEVEGSLGPGEHTYYFVPVERNWTCTPLLVVDLWASGEVELWTPLDRESVEALVGEGWIWSPVRVEGSSARVVLILPPPYNREGGIYVFLRNLGGEEVEYELEVGYAEVLCASTPLWEERLVGVQYLGPPRG